MVQNTSDVSISAGDRRLREIVAEYQKIESSNRNEAETRFQLIDQLLTECLGWPRDCIHVEVHQDGKYTDYELGKPRQVICEAKREGKVFELPVDPNKKIISDLPSIMLLDENLKKAIIQVQSYASGRGVQISIVTNGHQLVVFLAVRSDGISPLEGRCLVIDSLDTLIINFPRIWQLLSPNGIVEKKIVRLLTLGKETAIPQKLSSKLINYPKILYSSETQADLKQLSELVIQDIVQSTDIEQNFFKDCYCESGALSKYALISKNILKTRYASMFDVTVPHPHLTPVKPNKKTNSVSPEILSEALTQRPIVLLGDVGVGKTSFIKRLMYISAYDEFKKALYIYIDLGSQAALTRDLNTFILSEIERQLFEKYEVDLTNSNFIKGVYHLEIQRFKKGIYGELQESNPNVYNEQLIGFLSEKISEKDEYLRKSINHIAKGQKKQVILAIDNSDQRDFEIQQQAFIISQNLAKEWNAAVFIAVRPQTFYKSKQSGSLTAYPNKVFTISPPRVDNVIEKRLFFAQRIARGDIHIDRLPGINIDLRSLSLFIKALLDSLKTNKELVEFLNNITGGNIRTAIELVTGFIGSPNVDAEKILEIMEEQDYYQVPVHEFTKSSLLGDYSHFNPESSTAMNVYDVSSPDQKEHFLVLLILGFLDHDNNHKDKNGFVSSDELVNEFQNWGFTNQQIEFALRRTTNKKLIETSQRVTFAEDETGLIGDLPSLFRVTTIGAYHLKRWVYIFSYIDAMAFDTPIFDIEIRKKLVKNIESLDIVVRYERTQLFKRYLSSAWSNSRLSPSYFDFNSMLVQGDKTFDKVHRAIVSPRKK